MARGRCPPGMPPTREALQAILLPLRTGPRRVSQPQAGPAPTEPEAGLRRRSRGGAETALPALSPGNSRLEIGPRAEPLESCCGGPG